MTELFSNEEVICSYFVTVEGFDTFVDKLFAIDFVEEFEYKWIEDCWLFQVTVANHEEADYLDNELIDGELVR